jgi:hypothetical protein
MNIAITGAGDIGATLTLRLTALGHHVRVANSRGPETLAALAKETGAHPTALAEVTQEAEVVIVALPQKAIATFKPRPAERPTPARARSPHRQLRAEPARPSHRRTRPRCHRKQVGRDARWPPSTKAFNSIIAHHLLTLGAPRRQPQPDRRSSRL